MRCICAWCGQQLGLSAPGNCELISHGICAGCSRAMLDQLNNVAWQPHSQLPSRSLPGANEPVSWLVSKSLAG
jgi:hypothetical protein